jgi:hypothetical protein
MKDEETGLEVHSVPSTGLRSTVKEADRIARDNRNREVLDELFAVIGGTPAIKDEETGLLYVDMASVETAQDGLSCVIV